MVIALSMIVMNKISLKEPHALLKVNIKSFEYEPIHTVNLIH